MSYFGFLGGVRKYFKKKYFKKKKIPLIENGTVLDHLSVGTAFKSGKILELEKYVTDKKNKSTVSAVMDVDSKRVPGGKKDMLKIENRELDPDEVNKITLLSPYATISIIRDYNVAEKYDVELPEELTRIVRCSNPTCISNPKVLEDGTVKKEPIDYKVKVDKVKVKGKIKPKITCYYCEREIEDIFGNLIF